MSETQIYTHTLTNKFSDEYFAQKTYSGTIESSILHLIADMFSDDTTQINGTEIICEDIRKERIVQARAMFFWYLNKCLGYSHWDIFHKYGFSNVNVCNLIKKHEVDIEINPFIFHIHKSIWDMGEIWKKNGVVSEKNIVEVNAKHNKKINKLTKRHDDN